MTVDNNDTQVSDLLLKHYYAIIEDEDELQDFYDDSKRRYKHERSIETKVNSCWFTARSKEVDITRFKDCPDPGFDTVMFHNAKGELCHVLMGIRTTKNEVHSGWATVGYNSKKIGSPEGDTLINEFYMGLPYHSLARRLERLKARQYAAIVKGLDDISMLNRHIVQYKDMISEAEKDITEENTIKGS